MMPRLRGLRVSTVTPPDDPSVYAFGRLPVDTAEWGPCDVGQRLGRWLTDEREIDTRAGRYSEMGCMLRSGVFWVRPAEVMVVQCGYGGGPPCETAEQHAARLEAERLASIAVELASLYDDDESDDYDTGH